MVTTYSDKLFDPRWQRRRLEIFTRDHWMCQVCHDMESMLAPHHIIYLPIVDPWDYPDDKLTTLCNSCHDAVKILVDQHTIPELQEGIWNAIRQEYFATLDREVEHWYRIFRLYRLAKIFLESRPS